jgi:hypothetical protein
VNGDPTEAAYFGVRLWAQAVAAAGSAATQAIRRALRGKSCDAPEGPVRVVPQNQHTWKIARIDRITGDGSFKLFWSSDKPIPPQPFPAFRTGPPGKPSWPTSPSAGAAAGTPRAADRTPARGDHVGSAVRTRS